MNSLQAKKLKRRSIGMLNAAQNQRKQTNAQSGIGASGSVSTAKSGIAVLVPGKNVLGVGGNVYRPLPNSLAVGRSSLYAKTKKLEGVSSGYGRGRPVTTPSSSSRAPPISQYGRMGFGPASSAPKRTISSIAEMPTSTKSGSVLGRENSGFLRSKKPRIAEQNEIAVADELKEHLKVLDERLVKVEMSGAAIPAPATANYVNQQAYDSLLTKIQNLENSIQEKNNEIQVREIRIQDSELKFQEAQNRLEQKCRESEARREMLEDLSMTSEKLKAQMTVCEGSLVLEKRAREEKEEIIKGKQKEIKELREEIQRKNASLKNYELKQREMHEQIQDMKGNIRVYCRVRPFLKMEKPHGFNKEHLIFPDKDDEQRTISMQNIPGISTKIAGTWSFGRIFTSDASQQEIFTELSELIQSALHGYNVSIFAYGQTGSGKTYTMEGGPDPEVAVLYPDSEGAGIIPRAVLLLFRTKEELEKLNWKYDFKVSFLEIYNEEPIDLLSAPGRESDVRRTKPGKLDVSVAGKEVKVVGLTQTEVKCPEEVLGLMEEALRKRSVGATKCNERSSRSHALFQLYIQAESDLGNKCDSVLSLVDLAGSERLKESESVGERQLEAQYINSSLMTLKMVIRNQAQSSRKVGNKEPSGHVPFRDSKLTMLLKNSLGGGNSKTLMLTTVSPALENAEETKHTLDFAKQASECYIGAAKKQTGRGGGTKR